MSVLAAIALGILSLLGGEARAAPKARNPLPAAVRSSEIVRQPRFIVALDLRHGILSR